MTAVEPDVAPAEHALVEAHHATLAAACAATRTRAYWSPYPEHPKAYGEDGADAAGKAAFEALLGRPLRARPARHGRLGGRRALAVRHRARRRRTRTRTSTCCSPRCGGRDPGLARRRRRRPGPAVCLEILARINARTHEFAHAVMHTSGQAFMMAFQAGGPHAQDRGLEAVAYAYAEMTRTRRTAPLGEAAGQAATAARCRRRFTVVPRGIALVIGCNTFPTWNGYPGLFASLATGNAGPGQAAPRARCCRSRSRSRSPARCWPRPASTRTSSRWPSSGRARASPRPWPSGPRSGSSTTRAPPPSATGWRPTPARRGLHGEGRRQHGGRRLHRRLHGACSRNLAFSLSLYSGQMCTTPQNLLIPRDGIDDRRGPQDVRRGGRRPRRRGRRAARRRRPGERAARRDRQPGRARRGSRPPPGSARSPSPRGGRPPRVPRRGGPYARARHARRRRRRRRALPRGALRPDLLRRRRSTPPPRLELLRAHGPREGRDDGRRVHDRRRRARARVEEACLEAASRCR